MALRRSRLDKAHLTVGGGVLYPKTEWRERARLLDAARTGDPSAHRELWRRYQCRLIVPRDPRPVPWESED